MNSINYICSVKTYLKVMPISALGAGFIGAGLSTLGSVGGSLISNAVNSKTSYNLQRREQEYNQRMAEWQNEVNVANWQMQNDYNTPAAQMQRFQEAGLNPNLIYGNGTASAGNATSAPEAAKVNPAPGKMSPANFGDMGMSDAVNAFAQIQNLSNQSKLVQSQVDMNRASQDYNLARAAQVRTQTIGDALNNDRGLFSYNMDRELRQDIINKFRLGNTLLGSQIGLTDMQRQKASSDIDLNESSIALNVQRTEEISQRLGLLPLEAAMLNARINEAAQRIANMRAEEIGIHNNNKFFTRTYQDRVASVSAALTHALQANRQGELDFNLDKFKAEMYRDYGDSFTGVYQFLNIFRYFGHAGLRGTYIE